MTQSKMDSFIEAVINAVLGWMIYTPVNLILIPLVTGAEASVKDSFMLALLYTFVAVFRGLAIRRAFNGRSPWAWLKGKFS